MMQINGMRTADSLTTVQRTPVQPQVQGAKTARAIGEPEREPVSVSQDGDTVRVSPESRARLEDDRRGRVTVKEAPVRETDRTVREKPPLRETAGTIEEKSPLQEAIEAAKEKPSYQEIVGIAEEKPSYQEIVGTAKEKPPLQETAGKPGGEEKEVTADTTASTVGHTESDLRRMYLQGDISKNELDRAIEQKEERREALQKEEERFSREAVGMGGLSDKQKLSARELKYLFGANASDTLDPALRADAISKLENPPDKGADVSITGQVRVS